MKTSLLVGFCVALAFASPVAAAEPSAVGLWNQEDSNGHSWILIFERNGSYEGAIAKMFLKPGESMHEVCNKCKDDRKNAPTLGLSLVRGMDRKGLTYDHGTVLDPRDGDIYSANMKVSADGNELTLRGYLGVDFFGRSTTWRRIPVSSLAQEEVPPNLMRFWSDMTKDSSGPTGPAERRSGNN